MHTRWRTLIPLAAAAFVAAGCAQPAHYEGDGHDHSHDAPRGAPPGSASHAMQRQMRDGMQQMQATLLTGNVDKDFVRMMRMHHQQGVAMARVELDKGASPEVKAMARKIIEGQEAEIAQFDAWLRRNP
ncbi:MAG: DUF305 domain-containing protein [Comamonadaceae bacterium]|nr:MAG: DUF305 domain-containing protein [Comamonadaceae bacterium]